MRLAARFFSSRGVPCAQQLAQDQAQVERADMNQRPLQDILPPAQVAAPQTAGLVAVGKAALDQFAAPSE